MAAWSQWKHWAGHADLTFDPSEVLEFESGLSDEILLISRSILGGGFEFQPMTQLSIPKPSGGRRILASHSPADGIVAESLLNLIGPIIDSALSESTFAHRHGDKSNGATGFFRPWGDGWSKYSASTEIILTFKPETKFVITDISNYYPTIEKEQLLSMVVRLLPLDSDLIPIIRSFIEYQVRLSDGSATFGGGLPIGPNLAHSLSNLYLSDFDRRWESEAIHYGRYVDDMFFAFNPGDDVPSRLAEIDEDLRHLGLDRNEDKSSDGTVADPSILLGEARHRKYLIGRIDFQDADESVLETSIRDLLGEDLWEFVDADELARIGPHLRSILRIHANAPVQSRLLTMAMQLLSDGITDPAAIRSTLILITANSAFNWDSQFNQLIREGDPLTRAIFLRLIIEDAEVRPPTELLVDLASDQDPTIRTLAYSALRVHEVPLSSPGIRSLIDIEIDRGAANPALPSMTRYMATFESIPNELSSTIRNDRDYKGALIELIGHVDHDDRLFVQFNELLIDATPRQYLTLLRRSLIAGDPHLGSAAIEAVPENLLVVLPRIFESSLRRAWQIAVVLENRDFLANMPGISRWSISVNLSSIVRAQALLHLQLIVQRTSDDVVSELALDQFRILVSTDSDNPLRFDDGVPTATVCGTTYRYGDEVLSTPDGVVRIVNLIRPSQKRALLEIIPFSELKRRGFPTLEAWRGYLDGQIRHETSFPSCSIIHDDICYTVYEVDEGFDSVESQLDDLRASSTANLFRLLGSIGQTIQRTGWAQGKFQSAGPQTVYSSSDDEIRLIGFGLACVEPYYGGQVSDPLPREASPQTYQLFLTYLLNEIRASGAASTETDPITLMYKQQPRVSMLFGYIWSRMGSADSSRRYDAWETALRDISSATNAQMALERASVEVGPLSAVEVALYLDFRLAIRRRMPTMSTENTRDFSSEMTRAYLAELERALAVASVVGGDESLSRLSEFENGRGTQFTGKKNRKNLLYLTRVLIGLAERYSDVLGTTNTISLEPGTSPPAELLRAAIWQEAERLVKSRALHFARRSPEEFGKIVDDLTEAERQFERDDTLEIAYSSLGQGVSGRSTSATITVEAFHQLKTWFEGIRWNPGHRGDQFHLRSWNQLSLAGRLLWGGTIIIGKTVEIKFAKPGSETPEIERYIYQYDDVSRSLAMQKASSLEIPELLRSKIDMFVETGSRLQTFARHRATVIRFNFLSGQGVVRYSRMGRSRDIRFDESAITRRFRERRTIAPIPCTIDVADKTGIGEWMSTGPEFLVGRRRSATRKRFHRYWARWLRATTGRKILLAKKGLWVGGLIVFAIGAMNSWWAIGLSSLIAGFLLNETVKIIESRPFRDS